MTFALILIPTLCYLGAALQYWMQGNHPQAIIFAGYGFANCGLLWLDWIAK